MIAPIVSKVNSIHKNCLDIADFIMSMPKTIHNDKVMRDLNRLVKDETKAWNDLKRIKVA